MYSTKGRRTLAVEERQYDVAIELLKEDQDLWGSGGVGERKIRLKERQFRFSSYDVFSTLPSANYSYITNGERASLEYSGMVGLSREISSSQNINRGAAKCPPPLLAGSHHIPKVVWKTRGRFSQKP